MLKKNSFKIFTVIIAILVVANAYLLLRNNDVIEKSYYIGDYQLAASDTHTEELQKQGILSASQNTVVAVDIKDVEEVYVKRSDAVTSLQELAKLKTDAIAAERQNLEIKLAAYETELAELENILSYLEDQSGESNPSTAADSTSVGDSSFWNLDVTLELGIEQNTPTAEGEAIISRHIAETERNIEIINNSLSSLEENRALVAPIDGVIGDIIQEGDTLSFVIYPASKSTIVYIDEEQWQRVALDQTAEIIVRQGKDDEMTIEGTVVEKQQIPAEASIWYEEMLRHEKIDPSETLYEVKIEPFDYLEQYPYGEKVATTITTEEVFNSFMTPKDWIIEYEVEDIGNTHIYTLGYDGRTRLTPIDVQFTKKGIIEEPVEEEELDITLEEETEQVVEETPEVPKIQTVDLAKEDEEQEEPEKYDVTVFTGTIDENTVLLDGTPRNIYAPTFRAYPLERYDWDNVGPLTWKDIATFMIQP